MLVLAAPSFLPLLSCPVNFLVIAAIVQAAQCTVLIALDRTLAIKYPLHYPLWMTNARAVAVVALSVVASLTYAAIMVNEVRLTRSAICVCERESVRAREHYHQAPKQLQVNALRD